ncbi:unnamed protein product [Prunus armeniaca]|uniref:Uncharacterized protein n=1 Tax=Prunus armeniaca TaxID=36596 RepID=A0A6J5XAQ4_PRUAR|nr:unnamed protein product [Prunus armeniaca]
MWPYLRLNHSVEAHTKHSVITVEVVNWHHVRGSSRNELRATEPLSVRRVWQKESTAQRSWGPEKAPRKDGIVAAGLDDGRAVSDLEVCALMIVAVIAGDREAVLLSLWALNETAFLCLAFRSGFCH